MTAREALVQALSKLERIGWIQGDSAQPKPGKHPGCAVVLADEEYIAGYCMIGALYAVCRAQNAAYTEAARLLRDCLPPMAQHAGLVYYNDSEAGRFETDIKPVFECAISKAYAAEAVTA